MFHSPSGFHLKPGQSSKMNQRSLCTVRPCHSASKQGKLTHAHNALSKLHLLQRDVLFKVHILLMIINVLLMIRQGWHKMLCYEIHPEVTFDSRSTVQAFLLQFSRHKTCKCTSIQRQLLQIISTNTDIRWQYQSPTTRTSGLHKLFVLNW